MALDPSIPMSGVGVNALGALSAGNDAAAQQNEYLRQRAYQNMLSQNGPGIIAGDQGALNALAGYDPAAALGVQESRLGMDATRQNMAIQQEELAMRREQAKQAAAEKLRTEAAAMDAATLAAEKEKLNQTLSGAAYFYQRKDKAGYDAFLRGQGVDPAQYAFDMFPAYAAMGQGVLDAMEAFAPPPVDPMKGAPEGFMWTDPTNPAAGVAPIPGYAAKPADDYQRYVQEEQAAGRTPLSRLEFESAKKGKGISVTTRNPDGSETIMSVGGAGGDKPTTVGDVYTPGTPDQAVELIDAIINSPALDRVTGAIVGGGGNNVDELPFYARAYYGHEGVDTIEKIGQLQSQTWMAARAMLKGGGAITDYESRKAEAAVARLSRTKDSKELRAALTELRDAITEGRKKLEAAGMMPGQQPATAPSAGQSGTMPATPQGNIPAGIDPADWEYMTPEERALFQ